MQNYLKILNRRPHPALVDGAELFDFKALAQTLSLFVLSFSCLIFTSKAQADPISADATLPLPSAVVCSGNSCTINNGTPVGSNLFHSFSQFSVPTGGVAYFNNEPGVVNIFSRVTGASISNIDGLLKANGSTNLFLLNPNGIIFGSNARLDLSGSFVGSTATAIKFDDGTFFSTTAPQTTPLLKVSVPVGLQFGSTPGRILVQGNGQGIRSSLDPIDTNDALRVPSNQTLALVGGDIAIAGGTLKTAGGRIELGSVGEQSLVALRPIDKGWALNYDGVSLFRDIQLSGTATVDASGLGGGDIQVRGRTVSVKDGSQIEASILGEQPGGTLTVNATESVELMGTISNGARSAILTEVYPGASGSGGQLTISTGRLLLDGGAVVDASTFPGATGNAGNLTINTGKLIVRNGSQISATTFSTGAGGTVTVNASESVELIGTDSEGLRSGLFTVTTRNGTAGNLTINTNRLVIRDGARASTSTRRGGRGGTLTVDAKESVELSGISADGENPSGLFALSGEPGSGTDPLNASGPGGSLRVNTGQLIVKNGAQLSVSAQGAGEAGNLDVNAGVVRLDNFGSIRAETKVGTGGNIDVRSRDYRMRHNSAVTTNATGTATGGNITLHTDTLVALENSDITANAVQGRGGNITISAQGIFRSPDSDITASSQLGINGVVEVKTLGFDVKNTLTPLTGNFVSAEQAVAGSCLARRNGEQGSFTVTGTGGLPSTPYDAINGRYALSKVTPITEPQHAASDSATVEKINRWKLGDAIVEAQGIVRTPDGRTLLGTVPPVAETQASDLVCHSS
jgi:filamentous hemagglutinin family protein